MSINRGSETIVMEFFIGQHARRKIDCLCHAACCQYSQKVVQIRIHLFHLKYVSVSEEIEIHAETHPRGIEGVG